MNKFIDFLIRVVLFFLGYLFIVVFATAIGEWLYRHI